MSVVTNTVRNSTMVFLGLGANLGEPVLNFRRALNLLLKNPEVRLRAVSSLYRSMPVGPVENQPEFINAVAELETNVAPEKLLARCLDIEQELGRVRDRLQGPRNIDLDILLYGDQIIHEGQLDIPHLALRRRAFVLFPLLELNEQLDDPRDGSPLRQALSQPELQSQKITRVGDATWFVS